jgi:hypothetical protein
VSDKESERRQGRDLNTLAKRIVDEATDEDREPSRPSEKNAAAVERGKARASKLTPERRSEIAKRAARARWNRA